MTTLEKARRCWRAYGAALVIIFMTFSAPSVHAAINQIDQAWVYAWMPDYNYRTDDPDGWEDGLYETLWLGGVAPDTDLRWRMVPFSGAMLTNPDASQEYVPLFPPWGWSNTPVPVAASTDLDRNAPWNDNFAGEYRVMTNYWNMDTVIPDESDFPEIVSLETGYLRMDVEDGGTAPINFAPGTFRVLESPNSYWANGRPRTGPQDTAACVADIYNTDDPCHWAPNKEGTGSDHAPAAYPAIYNGCHYGQCTAVGPVLDPRTSNPEKYVVKADGVTVEDVPGAPYPIRLDTLTGIPSRWLTLPVNAELDGDTVADDAIYNIAYDIWLDRNTPRTSKGFYSQSAPENNNTTPPWHFDTEPADTSAAEVRLPEAPENMTQNDGLEIMIWVGNNGYVSGPAGTDGEVDPANPKSVIRPAGNRRATNIAVPGVSGLWDVWVTDGATDLVYPDDNATAGAPLNNEYARWYVVSYVRVSKDDFIDLEGGWVNFQFDSKWFINHASDLDCKYDWTFNASVGAYAKGAAIEKCVDKSWWLTSIQAGFEIWANGSWLQSNFFEAKPTTEVTLVQGGRYIPLDNGEEKPAVYWGEDFLVTAACGKPDPADSGTYTITRDGDGTLIADNVAFGKDNLGIMVGPVAALYPLHDDATLSVEINCADPNSPDIIEDISFYIDPAGQVKTTDGQVIPGAKTMLYYKANPSDPFIVVPDGSAAYMSEKNRNNPTYTGQYGDFSWDVVPGYYKVRAGYGHCHKPGDPSVPYVETADLHVVDDPIIGLELVLECPQTPADTGGGSGSGEAFCNWYSDGLYPICDVDTGWWGWENNTNCISQSACDSTGNDTVGGSGSGSGGSTGDGNGNGGTDPGWTDENGIVTGDGDFIPGDGGVPVSSIPGIPSSSNDPGDPGDPSGGSGSYTITVHARGDVGTEKIHLTVGGVTVATWHLNTSFQDYTVTTDLAGGINVVYFDDVPYRGDVVLDYVSINNVIHQAEDQTQNTATYGNGTCGGGGFSEWMHCNGYIGFSAFK